jgi:hypothetical protein
MSSSASTAAPSSTVDPDSQQALDALHGACTDSDADLLRYATNGADDLAERGFPGETQATVLQHLRQSLPSGAAPIACAQILAAYILMRASGS